MTNEEQVIKEAEDILQSLRDKIDQEQSAEHMRAMPHFRKMAQQLIAQAGKAHCSTHLFFIKGDDAIDPDTLPNPLEVEGDDRMGAEFTLTHSFPSYETATHLMTRPEASVSINEARKKNAFALFVMTRDNLLVCYAGRKLTVSRAGIGDDLTTHHVDIASGDIEPDEFMAQCQLTDTEGRLVKSLLMLAEAGRLMEKETPAIYEVMAKRIRNISGDGEDSDEA